MPFRENLKLARKKARLTQKKLGDELHITSQAVSGWERGESQPELDKVPFIAKALQTSVGALFDEAGASYGSNETLTSDEIRALKALAKRKPR